MTSRYLRTNFDPINPNAKWGRAYRDYQKKALRKWSKPWTEDEAAFNDKNEVGYGVEGSTTRAMSTGLRGSPWGPQAAYREWAYKTLAKLSDCSLDSDAFEEWHKELCRSLEEHWNEHLVLVRAQPGAVAKPPLRYAHVRKLVDLFVRYMRVEGDVNGIVHKGRPKEQEVLPDKRAVRTQEKPKKRKDRIMEAFPPPRFPQIAKACYLFGHTPLDMKSIHVLRETFGLDRRKKYSMGVIKEATDYNNYQEMAREVCRRFGGTPLLFDVFCWEHPEARLLYKPQEDEEKEQEEARMMAAATPLRERAEVEEETSAAL